ncbi:hypothetical protein [Methylobacterium sp. WL19]|uniref:phage baseplate plug family protein n=1 Tax=Methylobacterium sp. WL19 TaxID=2603896 RepID=UPI0011C9C9CD|nr:hypothetical protein [Methylobacterium sp. WL19]TXN33896.1 hypothetical protein FV220_00135 [Methylobacterium sp. WL19]
MATYEIPLVPQPQIFGIQLGDVNYRLRFAYADTLEGGWLMDINTEGGDPILCGVPLVPSINLLAQYAYLGLAGGLMVTNKEDEAAMPAFAALGTTSKLYFVSVA